MGLICDDFVEKKTKGLEGKNATKTTSVLDFS